MIIGFFGTAEDRDSIQRLREFVGAHSLKCCFTRIEFWTQFALKVKQNQITECIVTCQDLLNIILAHDPTYQQPFNGRGQAKVATLNDFHGSYLEFAGAHFHTDYPVRILILNPLSHLHKVSEAKFIFKRHISKITQPEKWFPQTSFSWETLTAANEEQMFAKFQTALMIGVDIETIEDNPHRTIDMVGYCGLFPDGTTHSVVLEIKSFEDVMWVRKWNNLRAPKVMQGGKYDAVYFMRYGAPLHNWLYDTQNLFHCWYAELPKRLDYITAFCCRFIRFWKDDGKVGSRSRKLEYNARDCWATLMSCLNLLLEMPEWAKKNYLFEFPLVFPFVHVELDGLAVDQERFKESQRDVTRRRDLALAKLQSWIHPNFNPNSPPQCKNLLKVLGYVDRSGNVDSSGEKVLIAASAAHSLNERILSEVLEYRGWAKLTSTYLVDDKIWNGRFYYRIDENGTESGRGSSKESSFWCGGNVQNIPGGKEGEGHFVKNYIRVDDGWDGFAECDKAQSEARCVGYLSGCQKLIDLVESEKDYHSFNASQFFGIPYEQIWDPVKNKTIDKPLRDLSKRTNHGANYNMGKWVMLETMGPKKVTEARRLLKLAPNLSLDAVCAHLLNRYELTYPEVKKDWYDAIKREIKLTRKIVSPTGWTRYFFDDPASSKPALNSAVAHGPQHLSVWIVNREFYAIWKDSVYGSLRNKVRLKAHIHDSIFFAYRGIGTPEEVRKRMNTSITVKDCKGVERKMFIPSDVSSGSGFAKYWSDLK